MLSVVRGREGGREGRREGRREGGKKGGRGREWKKGGERYIREGRE